MCWRTFDFSCNPTQQALSLLLCGPPSGSCFSFIRAARKRLLFRSNQRHFSSSFSAAATWYSSTREAKAMLQNSYESSDAALRQCRCLRSFWGDIFQNIIIFILKSSCPQILLESSQEWIRSFCLHGAAKETSCPVTDWSFKASRLDKVFPQSPLICLWSSNWGCRLLIAHRKSSLAAGRSSCVSDVNKVIHFLFCSVCSFYLSLYISLPHPLPVFNVLTHTSIYIYISQRM